jgi:uncharacterized membrane protein YphA (DoxX/SURF4 family)
MFGSAIPDVMMADIAKQGFAELQLPAYLLPFVGIAKISGVIAILIPGYSRLKEWAYAGLTFDLIGATYCIAASGKAVENWAPNFLFLFIAFGSYLYYHKKLKADAQSTLNEAQVEAASKHQALHVKRSD